MKSACGMWLPLVVRKKCAEIHKKPKIMHYEQCSLRKIKGACLRPQRTILGNVCWQKGRLRLFDIKTKVLMTDLDLLRAELDDFAQPVKKKSLTPREERIIAGFEDIQQFVEDHGRVPERSEERRG